MTNEQRKQLVEVAKTLSEHSGLKPLIFTNSCKGVTALCLAHSVANAEQYYTQKVESGVVPATDKVTLHVLPTFTFSADESYRRPIHTGNVKDQNYIMNTILSKMFGSKVDIDFDSKDRTKEDETHFEIIGQKLVKRDYRIYVPFAGDTYERVWYFYSKTTTNVMMDLFLMNVPSIY